MVTVGGGGGEAILSLPSKTAKVGGGGGRGDQFQVSHETQPSRMGLARRAGGGGGAGDTRRERQARGGVG